MSKTDKTRPWWVRMAEIPMVTCRPVHDHRFGPCTLPAEVTAESASPWHRTSGCYWRAAGYHQIGCNSAGCSREWNHFRSEERRRSRRLARHDLRTHRDEY